MNDKGLIELFLDMLWAEQGLSDNTLSAYGSDLNIFANWLTGKTLLEVDSGDVSGFLANRFQQGISSRSSARILSSLRRFYGFLVRESRMTTDPTAMIESPHTGRPLPVSLSEQDVERLLDAPEISLPLGHRDRTADHCR